MVSRATFPQVIHIDFADKFFGFLVATRSLFLGFAQTEIGPVTAKWIQSKFYLGDSAKLRQFGDECLTSLGVLTREKGLFNGLETMAEQTGNLAKATTETRAAEEKDAVVDHSYERNSGYERGAEGRKEG